MIVKVQLSLMSTHKEQRALIYNKSQSIRWEGPAEGVLVAMMDGQHKAFYHAHMSGTIIVLDRPAKDRDW
jgi:hypothetical protein